MIFNFIGHRDWTFRAVGDKTIHLKRYGLVLVSAVALQVLFFWIGHGLLHLFDLVVAPLVVILISVYTYLMHRTFTFKQKSQI